MRKRILGVLLAAVLLLLLCGCETTELPPEASTAVPTTEPTVPPTVPEDGDPDDVTCQGSYTSDDGADRVIATVNGAKLTNSQLRAWYYAEVAQYRQEQHDVAPDFEKPLDTQVCQIDDSVNSWQQYFLRRALQSWHAAQALSFQAEEEGLPVEEAYQPIKENHEKYLSEAPATRFLYRFNEGYQPNTLHEAYLNSIPTLLEELAQEKGYADAAAMAAASGITEEDLAAFARLYNFGYMYFTNLDYYIEPTAEEVEAYFAEKEADFADQGITRDSGSCVDMRHILVVPDALEVAAEDGTVSEDPVAVAQDGTITASEAVWDACLKEATDLYNHWRYKTFKTEATFSETAYWNSEDTDSACAGGAYTRVRKGQLTEVLDEWCFAPERKSGDTEILRSDYGYHIVYFSGSTELWYAEAETALKAKLQSQLTSAAKEAYPAKINYSAIALPQAEAVVSTSDVLYPDVAHERFPEVPLYLQQDYQKTLYGAFRITTHGCGITTMAMLASYMTDNEITPPELCVQYGRYCHTNGTDGMLFINEPAVLGFYFKERSFDWREAKAALEEGYTVVAIQHKGYWTSGGHYLLFEELTESGKVRVRDSNIFNYGKLPEHKVDEADWYTLTKGGSGYWIFEPKVKTTPSCSLCGEPDSLTKSLLKTAYQCEKCEAAQLRRATYLSAHE